MSDTDKQVCLIVGAGTGLGSGLARVFGHAGFQVVMARRDASAAKQQAATLADLGLEVSGLSVDATDSADVSRLFAQVAAQFGVPDVLIFNVGGNLRASILDTPVDAFEGLWRAHTLGGFLVGQAAAQAMVARGSGSIMFTGATASLRGGHGFAAFAAAKSGLRTLAQSMARELGPQGVHVAHVVIDGGIDSPRVRQTQPQRVEDAGPDGLLSPDHIAQQYLGLHRQPRDCWSFEVDLRPWSERW
jgi:NAD(P)-dependent dehydrogenase (short-subunit alcohol dehydrogenase family)